MAAINTAWRRVKTFAPTDVAKELAQSLAPIPQDVNNEHIVHVIGIHKNFVKDITGCDIIY